MQNKENNNVVQDEFFDDIPEDEVKLLAENSVNRKCQEELASIYDSLDSKNITKEEQKTERFDEVAARLQMDHQAVKIFTDNAKEDRRLKGKYAIWLFIIFVIQLIYFDGIFLAVGLKLLKYSEITLNIFVTGALIQIIALVAIIVHYLFQDNVSTTIKNILEHGKNK